jgi:hypothetical protein
VTKERQLSPVLPGLYAPPQALFFCGALLFPPFLLQQDVVMRACLIAAFMALNALAGKRVRLLQFAVVAAGIVLFNLILPTGRVLALPLGLPITEGALKSGLMKATAMTGLIVLSQFSIRPSLRLPGRFGGLVGKSLVYFEAIMGERRSINRSDIIGSIDNLLISVGSATQSTGTARSPGTVQSLDTAQSPTDVGVTAAPSPWQRRGGLVLLVLLVAANWGLFAWTLVHPRPGWGA